MEEREAADAVNDFGRDPIGEGKEEQVLSALLSFSFYIITPNAVFLQSSNTTKNSRRCWIAIGMMCRIRQRWGRIRLEIWERRRGG